MYLNSKGFRTSKLGVALFAAVFAASSAQAVALSNLSFTEGTGYTNVTLNVTSDGAGTVDIALKNSAGVTQKTFSGLVLNSGANAYLLDLTGYAAGKNYGFTVTPNAGDAVSSSYINAGWQTNRFFRADATVDPAVYENGAWDPAATPEIESGAFKIAGEPVTFGVTDATARDADHAIIDFRCDANIDSFYLLDDITNDVTGAIGALSLVSNETQNTASWMVLTNGTGWAAATGALPTLANYDLRMEVDYNTNPAKIRYSVKTGDADWSVLNVAGDTWVDATNNTTTVTNICFAGRADVAKFGAKLSTAALVEADGTEYTDVATALTAAGAEKKVVLFTNLALSPIGLPAGTYQIDKNSKTITAINIPGVAPATEGGAVTVGDDTLEISSGTFVAEMSDGVFAQAGNLRYFTLNAAAAAVTNGATVFLLADDLASSAVFAKENVTFDMRGYTLAEADPDTPVVTLQGAGNKLMVTGWGVVTGMHTSAFLARDAATLVLDGVIVTNGQYNANKHTDFGGKNWGDAVAIKGGTSKDVFPTVIVSNGWFQASIGFNGQDWGQIDVYGGYFAAGNGYTDDYPGPEDPKDPEGWDLTAAFNYEGDSFFVQGGKFTAEPGVNPEFFRLSDMQLTSFAVPVTTNGHTFTREMMQEIPGVGENAKVWVAKDSSGNMEGTVQLPDSFVSDATGKTGSEAQDDLNTAAGYQGGATMKKWHCYVLGMPASAATTTTTEGPYVSGVQDSDTGNIGFNMKTPEMVKAAESGCKVEYEVIECSDPSGTATGVTSGRVNWDESAKIANPTDGAKYYKMKVYITPKK